MIVEYDRYEADCRHLGPENSRFAAVWLHGCSRGCKGCIAAEWNRAEAKYAFPAEMLAQILCMENPQLAGVVLSGGEPMMQPEGILALLAELNENRPEPVGVMLYTGFAAEELLQSENAAVAAVLRQTDILVDGAYIEALDDGKPYRGSANQKMRFLSDRYSAADFPRLERNAKIGSSCGEIYMSGIPDEKTRAQWKQLTST